MQCGDVSYAKRARVLSRNERQEIVMDSDSDEDKYRATQESEDEEEPRPPPHREVTEAEMFSFLALTLQMGHTVQDRLEDYWIKMEQLGTLSMDKRWHMLGIVTYYAF